MNFDFNVLKAAGIRLACAAFALLWIIGGCYTASLMANYFGFPYHSGAYQVAIAIGMAVALTGFVLQIDVMLEYFTGRGLMGPADDKNQNKNKNQGDDSNADDDDDEDQRFL